VGTFGAYGTPEFTSGTLQGFDVENQGELYAKLPLGAASLSGRLEAGEALHLSYFVSGVAISSRDALYRTEVDRDASCRDATHFVHSYALGAFELSSREHRGGSAEASGFGAGLGASRRHSEAQLGRGGDLGSCKTQQQTACRVPIRLTLREIKPGAAPELAAGQTPAPGEMPQHVRDKLSNTQNVIALWKEAVTKWTEKRDGAGCVAGMDQAARLDPEVRQNGAFQNVYWRCLMGAGRCDDGSKYLRDLLAAEDRQHRKSDADLDKEVREEANRACPSATAKTDGDFVIRAARELAKASSSGDAPLCRERFEAIARRYPKLTDFHEKQTAERGLEAGWRCVAKASGCAAAAPLYTRSEKLQMPNRKDALITEEFGRACRDGS
jgi:hypothetical protein